MVEHRNQSQPNPGPRPPVSPCTRNWWQKSHCNHFLSLYPTCLCYMNRGFPKLSLWAIISLNAVPNRRPLQCEIEALLLLLLSLDRWIPWENGEFPSKSSISFWERERTKKRPRLPVFLPSFPPSPTAEVEFHCGNVTRWWRERRREWRERVRGGRDASLRSIAWAAVLTSERVRNHHRLRACV